MFHFLAAVSLWSAAMLFLDVGLPGEIGSFANTFFFDERSVTMLDNGCQAAWPSPIRLSLGQGALEKRQQRRIFGVWYCLVMRQEYYREDLSSQRWMGKAYEAASLRALFLR